MNAAEALQRSAPGVAAHARGRPSGHLFVPSVLRRRMQFLVWLRRTHAWLGLWGAGLALLFGSTGFLLNHRAVMKVPAAKLEQSVAQLPLDGARPATAQALAAQLQQLLGIDKAPLAVKAEPAQTVTWNGRTLDQPPLWRVTFATPGRSVNAEYWVGNAYVTVKRQDANLFALLTRLHTGTGASAAWVLLVDTLAGAMLVLALTGILLWSRLHGPRLAAISIMLASLSLTACFAWQLM